MRYCNLTSCFVNLLPPSFHRGWSLISILHPKLSQCLFLDNPDCNRRVYGLHVFLESFVKFYAIVFFSLSFLWICIILRKSITFTVFLRIDWKWQVFLIKDLRRKGFWFFWIQGQTKYCKPLILVSIQAKALLMWEHSSMTQQLTSWQRPLELVLICCCDGSWKLGKSDGP